MVLCSARRDYLLPGHRFVSQTNDPLDRGIGPSAVSTRPIRRVAPNSCPNSSSTVLSIALINLEARDVSIVH